MARDIVKRLRNTEFAFEPPLKAVDLMEEAADEITRLRVENIQMQAALGYGILAEDERHIIPTNPYKCGICDANQRLRAENEKLRAALEEIAGISVSSWVGDIHGDAQDEWRDKLDAAISIARAALGEKP